MKRCKIYTLSDPLTKKVVYIGKTVSSLKSRLSSHIIDSRRHNRKICTWIRKLKKIGLIPEIELLDSCEIEEGASLEIFYIELFKYWGFKLKNHTKGGEGILGFKHSKKTRETLSKTRKKEKNSFYGKKHSIETKQKISKANKGRKMSESFCKRRSEYMKKHPISKLVMKKVAEKNKIKINQYDLNMNLIQTHNSAADAARIIKGLSTGHICSCCKGKRKSHKNFIWKYYHDV